jgi:hypothetical protein
MVYGIQKGNTLREKKKRKEEKRRKRENVG